MVRALGSVSVFDRLVSRFELDGGGGGLGVVAGPDRPGPLVGVPPAVVVAGLVGRPVAGEVLAVQVDGGGAGGGHLSICAAVREEDHGQLGDGSGAEWL